MPTAPASTARETPAPRNAGVDLLKLMAMLAVILTHAGPDMWNKSYTVTDWTVRHVWTSFHVPTFLAASGFLYYQKLPVRPSDLARRYIRILVPYLIASAVIFLFVRPPASATDVMWKLLTGSAFGIYYYVFLVVVLLPLIIPLSRWTNLTATISIAFVLTWLILASTHPGLRVPNDFFWRLRNPAECASFFCAGWWAHSHWEALQRSYERNKAAWWIAFGCLFLVYAGSGHQSVPLTFQAQFGRGSSNWPMYVLYRHVYTACVIFAVATLSRGISSPSWLAYASGATYTIYLYHKIVIALIFPQLRAWPPAVYIPGLTISAFAMSLAVVWVGQKTLGKRSKLLLGS